MTLRTTLRRAAEMIGDSLWVALFAAGIAFLLMGAPV